METSTLKGKFKVLSYIVAFIFMVGINIAMNRVGANKASVNNPKVEQSMTSTDDSMLRVSYLMTDSLSIGARSEKDYSLLKNEYFQ